MNNKKVKLSKKLISDNLVENKETGEVSYVGEERELDLEFIEQEVKKLQGRVLTIVDGCVAVGEQKKAVKDLINISFSDILSEFLKACLPGVMEASDYEEFILYKKHPEALTIQNAKAEENIIKS